jgi:Flp pilus assembly pilin Flp
MALKGHWRYLELPLSFNIKTSLGTLIDPVTIAGDHFPFWWKLRRISKETEPVARTFQHFWNDESGQDIAEYAEMLAVILVIVVGTIRLIGSNANNVFSNVASSIQ